jgi:hypothetical protein
VFWRELVKEKLEPNSFAEQHPGVVYKEWTNKHYAGGAVEYIRLTTAESIHRMAALRSASWGMFQIMGFNHKQCGFTSVADYVAAMQRSEGEQLQAFAHFVQHDTSMLNCLQKLDWAAFARAYNGPSYAANKYDERLAAAYKRFSA